MEEGEGSPPLFCIAYGNPFALWGLRVPCREANLCGVFYICGTTANFALLSGMSGR